ncbi:protein Shroom1 isoform 1-T4 [Menidia menidia]
MDSYSLHFERMRNVELHHLSLPVSRLSPAKSHSSIVDQLAHHQHGKGDSAYSSFSGGSTAPDYPSPFLPDDLQSSPFGHYADFKYVKSIYSPNPVLQSDSKTMDQLFRSVEAISQQYNSSAVVNHHNGSEAFHTHSKALKQERHSGTHPSVHPPPVPTRLDSFIATKNLENSRVHHHHGTEFQTQQPQPQQQARPHSRQPSGSLSPSKPDPGSPSPNSEPVYSVWRGSQQQLDQAPNPPSYRTHLQCHDQARLTPEYASVVDNKAAPEQPRSANPLGRPATRARSQSEHLMLNQNHGGGECNGEPHNKAGAGGHYECLRRRTRSTHNQRSSEPPRASSPRFVSSIQHKGQFYFVTGVCALSESGVRTHSASVSGTEGRSEVSPLLETHRQRERERSHSTMDNLFRPLAESSRFSGNVTPDDRGALAYVSQRKDNNPDQENHRPPLIVIQSAESLESLEEIDMTQSREIGRHTAANPIFYCGPDRTCPPQSAPHKKGAASPVGGDQLKHNKREDPAGREKWQPLMDVANERINKETTPLLYHLTGASRMALQPKKDLGYSITGQEALLNKPAQGDAVANDERPPQCDPSKSSRRDGTSSACNTLDDSFKKYYKEKLKDVQSKVLRETSFKRRDLQLSLPQCMQQKAEPGPTAAHSFSSSQDSETSTDTLTPSLTPDETKKGSPKEEVRASQNEADKETEKENGRPTNVAQPQVARIGGRKRLTLEQRKMCYSEPEKLHQLSGGFHHAACSSLGSESDGPFAGESDGEELVQPGEQGLVAARRKMFERRGRAQSASSASKTNLKHLQHKALVEYMERKTGQKVPEPQQPAPQQPPPPRQRHSLGERPFDWGPRPSSGSHEGKNAKRKLHRPHSAGRILDSSSSSVRYNQFFSAKSCSAQYDGHQNSSRLRESRGPSQGKAASVESLLDQPEPPTFFRTRSTSTPHAFQAHDYEEDPPPPNAMETSSSQKNASEESSDGPRYVRVVAQRGKSMEELGASKLTKISALSKSSEQLDQLWRNSAGPVGPRADERSAPDFADVRKAKQQERGRSKQTGKEPETGIPKNAQGQTQNQTPRKTLKKQRSEPGADAARERSSSRSNSLPSSSSSGAGAHSASPGSHGPSTDEIRTRRALSEGASIPPSPKGQEISEMEIKFTPSTPIHTKLPCEDTVCARVGTSPPVTGSEGEQTAAEPRCDAPPPDPSQEVPLSCGVTTDPSLWSLPPQEDTNEELQSPPLTDAFDEPATSSPPKQRSEAPASPRTSVSDADASRQAQEPTAPETETDEGGTEESEGRGTPGGETRSPDPPARKPQWEELVEAVVQADHSLARVLYPLANRRTALMLMEQLLSEDTLLMEEHYKKKQEQHGAAESTETAEGAEPSSCPPAAPDGQKPPSADPQSKADFAVKKHLLASLIQERLRSLEERRGDLQAEVQENAASGERLAALVRQRCQPVEAERYGLFIGDLERVVSLLLCLSARLARVQNALSTVDQHTDAEEKESLDSRHRLLCKQREDAKDLKDNLDRRENLVASFLSRQLSPEQLQDYRRFVQTKASLLIRLKDLEEKQKLGEEQLEALSNSP